MAAKKKVLTKSAAASENQTVDLARALGTKIRDVSGHTESLAKEMTESVNTTSPGAGRVSAAARVSRGTRTRSFRKLQPRGSLAQLH